MPGIDLLILLIFVVCSVTAGLRARRRASKGLEEYYLAGRDLKGWKAGVSMAASQFATDSPLLFCGLIATAGIFALWRVWIYALAILLIGFLFAAFWRRARVLTDAEFVEIRYSGNWRLPLRLIKALYFGVVINSFALGFVLLAALQISEFFLPWHTWLPDAVYQSVLDATDWAGLALATGAGEHAPHLATANNVISIGLMLAFVGLYSTTGGLRGVVSSDILQFGFAMGGSIVFAVILVGAGGGLSGLTERVLALYGDSHARAMLSFTPTPEGALLPFLTIVGLQWLFHMNSDGTGYLAQRFMACSADRQARIAAVVFSWAQILARSIVWLIIGVALLVLYPFTAADALDPAFAASRERTFLSGIDDFLPAGARGLMVTALLAAFASTLDTHLNWGSSYITNDVYRRFVCRFWLERDASNRELVLVARIASVAVLLLGCLVAANLTSIQQGWKISLLFGAGIGGVLMLRWIWERINIQAEFAAMAIALVAGPILLRAFPGDDGDWIRLATMVLVSTAGVLIVTLTTPRTEQRLLLEFYRTVRPLGFWNRTARLAGDSPAALQAGFRRVLFATLACGASLLFMLAGIAGLLLKLPGDTVLTPLLLVLAAVLLTPLWWRQLWAREPAA